MSVKESDKQELLSSLSRLSVYREPETGRLWVCNAGSRHKPVYAWIYLDDIPRVNATLTLPPSAPVSSVDGTGEQGVGFVEVDGHLGAKDENWCI